MSEISSNYTHQYEQELKELYDLMQLRKELRSATLKYFLLMSEYKEKLLLRDELVDQLIETNRNLRRELLECSELLTQCDKIEQTVRQLERFQQYREEIEWQYKLEQKYRQEIERGEQFWKKFQQKDQQFSELRHQSVQLEQQYEQVKEQTKEFRQEVMNQKQVVQELMSLLEQDLE